MMGGRGAGGCNGLDLVEELGRGLGSVGVFVVAIVEAWGCY